MQTPARLVDQPRPRPLSLHGITQRTIESFITRRGWERPRAFISSGSVLRACHRGRGPCPWLRPSGLEVPPNTPVAIRYHPGTLGRWS